MDPIALIQTVIEQTPNLVFAGVAVYLMQKIATRQAEVIEKVLDVLLEMAEKNIRLTSNENGSNSIKN